MEKQTLEDRLIEAMRAKADEIIEEEVLRAQERVAERLGGVADQAALSILSDYEVRRHGLDIVIKVKKA